MMDILGNDDARETSAMKSEIQPMKTSAQVTATHEACSHYPYRDWRRACVGGAGRSDAHKRQREEQNSLLSGEHELWFFFDEDHGEHTNGATPYFGGESPTNHEDLEHAVAMRRRGGPFSSQGNGRVAEPAMCALRDASI